MPNWCYNKLVASVDYDLEGKEFDESKKQLKKFKKQAKKLSSFVPTPEELLNINVGGREIDGKKVSQWREIDGKAVAIPDQELEALKKKHGALNWYDWNIANLGTKWDTEINLEMDDEEQAEFSFDTAWSPPLPWLETVSKMFPLLHFSMKKRVKAILAVLLLKMEMLMISVFN